MIEEIREIAKKIPISNNLTVENDDDILNCPLSYKFDMDPDTGDLEISMYKDTADQQMAKIKKELPVETGLLSYDGAFPTGFFASDAELDKLYDDLNTQLDYEDMWTSQGQEIWQATDKLLEQEISKFEQKELMDSLIQNDLSSSYQTKYLTGEITSESVGYLPQIEKQAFTIKDDSKVPQVRENFVIAQAPVIKEDELREKMQSLGAVFQTNFEENLEEGGEMYDLVKENIEENSYEEITRSQILPTSKRETKYLLGMDEKNKGANQIEKLVREITGCKEQKNSIEEYRKKKRANITPAQRHSAPSAPKFEGSYEELLKIYESKGHKVMKLKTQTKKEMKNKGKGNYVSLIKYFLIFSNWNLEICHQR